MPEHFNWKLFDHSLQPWSHLNSNEELMEGVKTWLSSQVAGKFPWQAYKTYCLVQGPPGIDYIKK
jgi:hypothetical protein